MIWEAKGNNVFCGLCRHFGEVHEVICMVGGVPVFVWSVHKDLSCVHRVQVLLIVAIGRRFGSEGLRAQNSWYNSI